MYYYTTTGELDTSISLCNAGIAPTGLMPHGFSLIHESVHEMFSATVLHGSPWSTLVNDYPLFEECSIECIGLVFAAGIGHPTLDLRVILDANQFKEVLCHCYHCSFGVKGHSPGM